MIQVLIRIEVQPEAADAFAQLTRQNCEGRAQAPGALTVQLLRDQEQPARFTLLEAFETQESIDAYYASAAYRAWHAEVAPMILNWQGSDQTDLLNASGPADPLHRRFHPSMTELWAATAPALRKGFDAPGALPDSLPANGLGEAAALEALAPLVLGQARRLDAAHSFDHMDPPTPWITWATTLWNASLNQNLLHPDTAPVAREIEARLIAWLAPFFGMSGGHMTAGASLANLTGLWAARERRGIRRVISSEAAHLSIGKAAHILGLEHVKLPADALGRMDLTGCPTDLQEAALVLTAGTTNAGAIDPLEEAPPAAWLHVDAAWSGPMRLSQKLGSALAGIERADSIAISAHKWLFQPKDSAIVLFRDAAPSTDAISFGGAYLSVPNIGVMGSSGARAVPLLATLLAFGQSGLAEMIEHAVADMERLYVHLSGRDDVILFAPPSCGLLLWRPLAGAASDVLARLPAGTSSLTTIGQTQWVRQVAANPVADIARVMAEIDAALALH